MTEEITCIYCKHGIEEHSDHGCIHVDANQRCRCQTSSWSLMQGALASERAARILAEGRIKDLVEQLTQSTALLASFTEHSFGNNILDTINDNRALIKEVS